MISRREWLGAFGASMLFRVPRPAFRVPSQGPPQRADTSNLFAMDQGAARSVRLAPKPNAVPSLTVDQRDALEHRIRCQCGCTLDVFTCRTTDFSCQVSPAMHRDIMALVQGGYTADEIMTAFHSAYGDQVLMAPPKVGFNIVGYVLPSVAIAVGGLVLALVIRGLRPAGTAVASAPLDATPDEMAKIDAAVRDDS